MDSTELRRQASFEFGRRFVYTVEDLLGHVMRHDVHHTAQVPLR